MQISLCQQLPTDTYQYLLRQEPCQHKAYAIPLQAKPHHVNNYTVSLPQYIKCKICVHCLSLLGYWHQRADERHGNPPPR